MSRFEISLATSICLLVACTSHTPGPETTPYPSQPTPAEPIVRTGTGNTTWEFAPSEQTNTYRSTSYTIVHEASSVRPRVDTLKLDTRFSVSLNQLRTPTAISGYIESATITQNSQPDVQLNTSAARTAFTGEMSVSELTLRVLPNQSECTSPIALILGEIRPAITSHPRVLSLTSAWTDSTSAITCTGNGIPAILKAIRSYRVLGETTYSRTQALIIERIETTQFSGSGNQNQHQIQIEGTGTATSKIYLDIRSGVTMAVENTQRIETVIKASGRLRRYIQDISQTIELAH